MIYDKNNKIPRFVILDDCVINQREGGKETYNPQKTLMINGINWPWFNAYRKLYKAWKTQHEN